MSIEQVKPLSLAEERYLQGQPLDANDMSEGIARRILSAETEDELFGGIEADIAGGSTSVENLLYEPLIFMDVNGYAKSKFRNPEDELDTTVRAFGFYTVTKAKPAPGQKKPACEWVSTGDPFVVSCGAVNVIAALDRAKELGMLPKALVIVEAEEPTAAGYRPYWARQIGPKHPLPTLPSRLAKERASRVQQVPSDEEPF